MIFQGQLGLTADDIFKVVDAIPGGATALTSLQTELKSEVSAAATAAMKPYIIGAYALGGVSLFVGLIAIFRR